MVNTKKIDFSTSDTTMYGIRALTVWPKSQHISIEIRRNSWVAQNLGGKLSTILSTHEVRLSLILNNFRENVFILARSDSAEK